MEKSKSVTGQKTKQSPAASKSTSGVKSSEGNKSKKTTVSKTDSSMGATAKVKSKVGHGLANEGTNGTYEESDR